MTATGALLLALGAGLLVLEAHFATAGAAGVGGVLCLVAGIALSLSGIGVVGWIAVAIACLVGLFMAVAFAFVVAAVLQARGLRVRGGRTGLIGQVGTVRRACDPVGQVQLGGAVWQARRRLADDPGPLGEGEAVVVEGVRGLTLSIRRAEDWELD